MLEKFKFKDTILLLVLIGIFFNLSCVNVTPKVRGKEVVSKKYKIITAANQPDKYIPLLKNKKVAVVANQTSVVNVTDKNIHLVDYLLSKGITVTKVFAPEHGFRGKADAGEHIENRIDSKTKLPIISLYGKNKKPNNAQLQDIEMVIFDIQDVGVRFYTYISTLHYIMEACAENNIPVLVLDRPNPNGHYIDGPILEESEKSFVGMHTVPIVYGMTIGEYAKMIIGEKWLKNGIICDLTVIPLQNYTHYAKYELPIKPSPNLPNSKAVNLYPSLAFFEGTTVSCGRGTELQFQIFGSPYLPKEKYNFSFIPKPNFGAKFPKHNGKTCYGKNLTTEAYQEKINLRYLINSYRNCIDKKMFFNSFFTKLAGTKKLQIQIEKGLSEKEIRNSWINDLSHFKIIRKKYLLYK